MEDSKNSGRWKKFLLLMIILLIAIILIYVSLQATPSPQTTTPAKPKSTSQQEVAKDKSGNKQATPSAPPSSANGQTSQNMVDTGPGDVAALFLLTVIFGYISHRLYLKRVL